MRAHAVLEEKRNLEKQIGEARSELRALPDLQSLENDLLFDKSRLADFRKANPGPAQNYIRDKREYIEKLEQAIPVKEKELAGLTTRKTKLNNRIALLERQLGQLDLSFSTEEVADIQKEWLELEERLHVLEEALSSTETGDKTAQRALDELNSLRVKHEDLLADTVLGVDGAREELGVVAARLLELQQQYELEKEKELAQERTAAGLRRKIEEVNSLVQEARQIYREALVRFIREEMDKAGTEYVEQAKEFSQSFLRIVALAGLCEDLGEKMNVFGPRTARFNIPAFRIEPCMEFINSQIFDFSTADITPAEEAEVERLAQQGLKLPL